MLKLPPPLPLSSTALRPPSSSPPSSAGSPGDVISKPVYTAGPLELRVPRRQMLLAAVVMVVDSEEALILSAMPMEDEPPRATEPPFASTPLPTAATTSGSRPCSPVATSSQFSGLPLPPPPPHGN